jgi:hypothetical protein
MDKPIGRGFICRGIWGDALAAMLLIGSLRECVEIATRCAKITF